VDVARPTLDAVQARAEVAGGAAVAATHAEREAIRERKRAEARERRERHARLVAARKQTDIVYLGRGVSQGLADRRANVEKLAARGLPVLAAPRDLATAMGLAIPKLRWLAFHAEAAKITHYVRFTVPKRSGGTRSLAAPMPLLAATQQWILENVLVRLETEDPAHGFVRGRSTVTNASPHVGAKVLVNFDLSEFFPTISFPRVRGYFISLGYSPAAATILGLLATEPPRREVLHAGTKYQVATGPRALPQGACTSPALCNLIARQLDRRLSGLAAKLGYEYTRYADDLTFSKKREAVTPSLGYLMARVRHICQDEGFAVNEKKTRVLRPSASQRVTGIVVNDRVNVPRQVIRRLRAILHQARFDGLDAQNREGRPEFRAWVLGMIAYVSMVNPERGAELRAAYERQKR
jgi:retron-type reverse transcriptase